MANLKFQDGAGEFRIEIAGKFEGACVHEVEQQWHRALADGLPRKITVDISRMVSCEHEGRHLLRTMHKHGTTVAAATPRSLVFLAEITAPARRPAAPTTIREVEPKRARATRAKAVGAGE